MNQIHNKQSAAKPTGLVDIPGYEGKYRMTIDGDVYSFNRVIPVKLKPNKEYNQSPRFHLNKQGLVKVYHLDELLLITFPYEYKSDICLPLKGFELLYILFKTGKVWSIRYNKFLTRSKDSDGYFRVTLKSGSKEYNYRIEKLLLNTFDEYNIFDMAPLIGDPEYLISKSGDVYSKKTHIFLTKTIDPDGYLRVKLHRKNKVFNFPVHRLVAEVYIPNPENKSTINHIDENKLNNHVSNLEWMTFEENTKASHLSGNRDYFRRSRNVQRLSVGTELA